MSFFSQASRMGRLSTVLDEDVLVLQRFEGSDFLNENFAYRVACLAGAADIDFDALLGTHATVALRRRDGGDAQFDGIVTEVRWLGAGENGHRYALTLQPWFYLASMRRNQRIFHNKTVVDILTELLAAYADAGRVKMALAGDYPELEYTVQYRESDMDFACRMMERHGISYHFEHSDGAHEMVLTDDVSSHATLGPRPFNPFDGHHQEEVEHFWAWRPARRLNTGSVRLTDYNFKTPTAAMEVSSASKAAHAHGQIESFDWPGDHLDQARGDVVARLRSEGEEGQTRRFEAEGDIPDLRGGGRVELDGSAVPDGAIIGAGEEYVCLAAHHSYQADSYGSGGDSGGDGDGYAYTGHYVLLPASAPMRPELKTPRADVKGPQTATVVGDGEIDCDEFGRILVQFHWDLEAAISMRCRVSQNWSGNGFGGMVIPRIGMEVVVEFLDGDPDKPLVTGCVYNGKNAVPYVLPEHKTRSTFKTDTHEGEGFNELRFEDKRGEEEIYVHAQKDMSTVVENDKTSLTNRHHLSKIKGSFLNEIEKSASSSIDGSLSLSVGVDTRTGASAFSKSIAGLEVNDFSKDFHRHFGNLENSGQIRIANASDLLLTSGKNIALNSGEGFHLSSRSNLDLKATSHLRLSASMGTIISSKKFLKIKSSERIVIGNGKAYITLHENGDIELTGKDFIFSAAGEITAKATKISLN